LFRFGFAFLVSILFCNILNAAITNNKPSRCSDGLLNVSDRCQEKPYVIFADFLYWTIRETGSDNWGLNFSIASTYQKIDVLSVPFKWNPGVRSGIDYSLNHDGWDIKAIYTWFFTQAKDHQNSISHISSPYLGNFYVNNADGSDVQAAPTYASAEIRWRILFNMFDWQLGRKYFVSSSLILRPFAGIKGGWIHQKIHTKWFDPTNTTVQNTFLDGTENLKNNFWGIGPSIGIDSEWKLGCIRKLTFNLFADFAGAILPGRWNFNDIYQNDQPQKVTVDTASFIAASSMLQAILGLKWVIDFAQGRSSFFAKIGYESQVWLSQLQFYSYNTGRLSNPLTLQGATIELSFNF